MILKYCAFLELHNNNYHATERTDLLMEKSENVFSRNVEGIMQRIMEENRNQYKALCNGRKLADIYLESELTYMHR